MTMTTRRQAAPAPAGDLAARVEALEKIQTTTLRILARAAVSASASRSSSAATFTQIVTNELRIATHEEAATIEAWLSAHPGG